MVVHFERVQGVREALALLEQPGRRPRHADLLVARAAAIDEQAAAKHGAQHAQQHRRALQLHAGRHRGV